MHRCSQVFLQTSRTSWEVTEAKEGFFKDYIRKIPRAFYLPPNWHLTGTFHKGKLCAHSGSEEASQCSSLMDRTGVGPLVPTGDPYRWLHIHLLPSQSRTQRIENTKFIQTWLVSFSHIQKTHLNLCGYTKLNSSYLTSILYCSTDFVVSSFLSYLPILLYWSIYFNQ